MKIALVHDFLKEYGGAERVLEALHEIYPEAPIYTAFVDPAGLGHHWERIKKWDIRPSWVQRYWLIRKLHSPLRFLAPLVWESLDLREYEVVISSSGWYICRGIITRPQTLHICYLHHPPRHLYGYKTALEWQKFWPIRVYGHLVNHYLRMYDYLASQRVDYFIANSKETKRRIAKFYRREATVIYPPVSLRGLTSREVKPPKENKNGYFLCVSRLARAKNINLAIEACQKLNLPLKIVGTGRETAKIKDKISNIKNIELLGEIPDDELEVIYAGAKALIFPSEDEEFGIVPVEAMAHGLPVIALRQGGIVESVQEATGVFFGEPTVESLTQALSRFKDIYQYSIKPEDCRRQAKKFSQAVFRRKITEFVRAKYYGFLTRKKLMV